MEKYRYCLRYAAGIYWLLDIVRPYDADRVPLQMNEMGADIVRLMNEGCGRGEMIRRFCEEYGVDETMAAGDLDDFSKMLASHGFEIDRQKGTVLL